MYAKEINKVWQLFNRLPSSWNNTMPYNWQKEGFKKVVRPEITDRQKLGDFYFDTPNDHCTYYIIDKTEEEIFQEKLQRYTTISKMNFRAQLILDGSITISAIDNAIAAIPVAAQRELIKNQWENAVFYERDNTALNSMAAMLGITQSQLDQIFINGNENI